MKDAGVDDRIIDLVFSCPFTLLQSNRRTDIKVPATSGRPPLFSCNCLLLAMQANVALSVVCILRLKDCCFVSVDTQRKPGRRRWQRVPGCRGHWLALRAFFASEARFIQTLPAPTFLKSRPHHLVRRYAVCVCVCSLIPSVPNGGFS